MQTIPMTDVPCPRCLALYNTGKIRGETVMPLPEGAFAPRAIEWLDIKGKIEQPAYSGPCCFDCQSADNLMKLATAIRVVGFPGARITIGNERQEMFRMPGYRLPNPAADVMKPSAQGDLERHHEWMNRHEIEPGERDMTQTWEYHERRFPEAAPAWEVFVRGYNARNQLIDPEDQIDPTLPIKLREYRDGLLLKIRGGKYMITDDNNRPRRHFERFFYAEHHVLDIELTDVADGTKTIKSVRPKQPRWAWRQLSIFDHEHDELEFDD